ncbi:hypothetical protein M8J76_017274 [Diaphorina citri]|nr:hypothetical protein M8J76_017274 [Diaphorina citri]
MNVSMKAVTSGTQGTGVHWFDRIVSCSLRCFQWGRKVFPRIPTLRIISGVARGESTKRASSSRCNILEEDFLSPELLCESDLNDAFDCVSSSPRLYPLSLERSLR